MTQNHPSIFIDARPTMGGIARYTYELSRLMKSSRYGEQVFLYGQGFSDSFKAASSVHGMKLLLRHLLGGAKRIMTDQLSLPLAAHRSGASLLHSTNFFVPLFTQKPVVVSCHDLSLLRFFSSKKAGLMKYYERFLLLHGLRGAAHVITISHAVASELKQHFGFLEKKVTVIYPPLPRFCHDVTDEGELPDHRIPKEPFFLSVGSIEPRKNLARLLEGWQRAYSHCQIPLVLVGPYGWNQRRLVHERLAATDGIYWLDNVNDTTLSKLYKKATAVVQYSLYEGFDYPVAEAICMGTPVVASDIEVHREVMAGCGLLASPFDTDALTAALLEVCSWSEQKLAEYRLHSKQQAHLIKQCSSVDQYISLYQQVLAKKCNGQQHQLNRFTQE